MPYTVDNVAATRPEFGAGPVGNFRHSPDGALQKGVASPAAMPGPLFTFEGPSNEANFTFFGIRVNPPDPNGDVGRNHYVAMVNLTYAVYSKSGTLLLGAADTGALWAGFEVDDCTDPSGDPIVVYDEKADRWILTQFTTRGPEFFTVRFLKWTSNGVLGVEPKPMLPGLSTMVTFSNVARATGFASTPSW